MVLLGSIVAPRVALIWVLFYHKTLAFSHKKSNQKYPGACPSIRKYYSGFNWLIFWCGTGVARARCRRSGGTEDTRVTPTWSLKKMVVLLNVPAMRQIDCGPKSEKIGTSWGMKSKKMRPNLRLRFLRGNKYHFVHCGANLLSYTSIDLYLYATMSSRIPHRPLLSSSVDVGRCCHHRRLLPLSAVVIGHSCLRCPRPPLPSM